MKYILILMASILLFSCSKDNVEVYTIASEKCVNSNLPEETMGSWYWAKVKESDKWFWLSRSIKGFDDTYEPGYEHTIRVKKVEKSEELADIVIAYIFFIGYFIKREERFAGNHHGGKIIEGERL